MRIVLNGTERDIADRTAIFYLLKEMGVNPERVAVEVNLQIIERSDFDHTLLKDGDKVEVISFVGGGALSNHGHK